MKTWRQAKRDYVAERLTKPSFVAIIAAAEKSAGLTMTRNARHSLAIEYAAAEFEFRQQHAGRMPSDETSIVILQAYLTSETDESLHYSTEPGFAFQSREPTLGVLVRTYAKYGRLKIELKPPIDTFTVSVGEDSYDSEDTLVLLVGVYSVVVERAGDKCSGSVTIREQRTTKFHCQ
jgi:hypothetical protein